MSSSLNLNNNVVTLKHVSHFCFRHTVSLVSALLATLALVTALALCLSLTGCGSQSGANGIVMDTSPIKAPSKTPPAETQTPHSTPALVRPLSEIPTPPATENKASTASTKPQEEEITRKTTTDKTTKPAKSTSNPEKKDPPTDTQDTSQTH